ncbi:MAG: hypothetical protein ACOX2K_01265 [Bacillota bacterium]|jgi:uncharacterized protein YbaR (Trm112 family)
MRTLLSNQSILLLGRRDEVMQRLILLCRHYGRDIKIRDLIPMLLQ